MIKSILCSNKGQIGELLFYCFIAAIIGILAWEGLEWLTEWFNAHFTVIWK